MTLYPYCKTILVFICLLKLKVKASDVNCTCYTANNFKRDTFEKGLECLKYDKYNPPNSAVTLNIALALLFVHELDHIQNQIKIEAEISEYWIDNRLIWPKKCTNSTEKYLWDLNSTLFWTPDYDSSTLGLRTETEFARDLIIWAVVIILQ